MELSKDQFNIKVFFRSKISRKLISGIFVALLFVILISSIFHYLNSQDQIHNFCVQLNLH